MGVNVKSEETMPKMLEKQLKGFEVYNMGVLGFGPDQELNVLEKYGFSYKPDMVIEGICSLNDSGDIYKDGIYTVGPKGELEVTETNPVKSMVFPSSFALVNTFNYLKNKNKIVGVLDPLLFGDGYDYAWMKYSDSDESKFKFSLMAAILNKMYDEVNKRKIPFLAVIIPSYNNICNDETFVRDGIDPNKYFVNEQIYQLILDKGGIPNINLVPFFLHLDKTQRCALYDERNWHLSAVGNWYVAQIIAHYMKY
jgi:hypothetical protein